MKRINILLLFIIAFGLSACFEDNSAVNYRMISPIRIEMGNQPLSYRIFSLDTLEIRPIVYKEGIPDKDISYLWELSGNLILPTILDTTMTLKKEINVAPQSNAYKLLYKITDNTTGIFVEQVYDVIVTSPFGGGLIVCDSKDGQKSDISLIMGRCFNQSVSLGKDTVMRNLFSRVNERKIDGIITSAVSTNYQTFRSLTIATSNSIERVDPFDYSYMDRDAEMFYIDPKVYSVSCLENDANSGYDFMINNGKMYSRTFQQMNKLYTYYLSCSDMKDYSLSKICKPYWNMAIGFDELNGRLVEVQYSAKNLQTLERTDNSENPFKATQLKDFTCIKMFTGRNATLIHSILQNKITKKIYSYTTKATAWYDKNAKENGMPLGIIDFSKCMDIENVIDFSATETSQDIIYYATKTKVYSVSFTILNNLVVREEYQVNEGEEITALNGWTNYRAGGRIYMTNPDPNAKPENKKIELGSQNRMLIVSTFNSAKNEGYINSIAISVVGTGKLEQDKSLHGRFGGFGKISYFGFQLQR